MVGTLAGTDRTFGSGAREASTHFGVGMCSKHGGKNSVCIHQYVLLGDQAWGNGNNRFPVGHKHEGRIVPSAWNNRYPQRLVNSRTISIEHQDNGGKGSQGRGIVPEEVIEASIWLDSLLLTGDAKALTAAGIRFRDGLRTAICRELRAINPGPHSIVDHHYIAGPLKPFCWQPWQKDKGGFPQARYLEALRSKGVSPPAGGPGHPDHGHEAHDAEPPGAAHGARPVSDGAEEEVMRSFQLPPVATLAKVRQHAWLYDNSALEPSRNNINIDPGREMPLIGIVGDARIVSYVDGSGKEVGTAYWVEAADVESTRPSP
jgi:hypothetical protein